MLIFIKSNRNQIKFFILFFFFVTKRNWYVKQTMQHEVTTLIPQNFNKTKILSL